MPVCATDGLDVNARRIASVLLWVTVMLFLTGQTPLRAQESGQRFTIVEPYIELHTGPGRGFPIFHVEKRHKSIELLKRRTDWYLVKTETGHTGWVTRAQLALTLTEAGQPIRFRDTVVDDFLSRRVELGLAVGDMEGDTIMSLRANYFFSDPYSAEINISQLSGSFTSSQIFSAHLLSQPFSEWRISPFFNLGIGYVRDFPRSTLVDPDTTNSTSAIAGIGARTYLTRQFLIRFDYRLHIVLVDEERTRELNEFSGGFSFFF